MRLRAMVELYTHDHRFQAKVDQLARQRSADLIRHHWPTHRDQT